MSAPMPERVKRYGLQPAEMDPDPREGDWVRYADYESALLAAEARVREVEEKLTARVAETVHPTHGMVAFRDCAKCGKPYPEWTVLSALTCPECKAATLRADLKAAQELEQLHLQNLDAAYAERDALVPLARWAVGMNDSQDYPGPDVTEEQVAQARARPAREEP